MAKRLWTLGEVEEVRSHLNVGLGREYLLQKDFDYLDKEYEGLGVGINFYIKDLEKQSKNS